MTLPDGGTVAWKLSETGAVYLEAHDLREACGKEWERRQLSSRWSTLPYSDRTTPVLEESLATNPFTQIPFTR